MLWWGGDKLGEKLGDNYCTEFIFPAEIQAQFRVLLTPCSSSVMSASSQGPEQSVEARPAGGGGAVYSFVVDQILDSNGWPVWEKCAGGGITYYECDAATGLVLRKILDVNLFLYKIEMLTAGHGAPVPEGWKTPVGGGRHHCSAYEYDELHRVKRYDSWYHPGESPGGGRHSTTYEYDALHRLTSTMSTFYLDEMLNPA